MEKFGCTFFGLIMIACGIYLLYQFQTAIRLYHHYDGDITFLIMGGVSLIWAIIAFVFASVTIYIGWKKQKL